MELFAENAVHVHASYHGSFFFLCVQFLEQRTYKGNNIKTNITINKYNKINNKIGKAIRKSHKQVQTIDLRL